MEQDIAIVGLDLATNVLQVHAIGADGAVLVRRKLRRAEVIDFFTDIPLPIFQVASSVWRHAHPLIIGPEN